MSRIRERIKASGRDVLVAAGVLLASLGCGPDSGAPAPTDAGVPDTGVVDGPVPVYGVRGCSSASGGGSLVSLAGLAALALREKWRRR